MSAESGADENALNISKPAEETVAEPQFPSASVEQQQDPKKEELPKPHFKFILTGHGTKEHAEEVVKALDDCDVIAMESVGEDAERRDFERSYWQELIDEPRGSTRSSEILSFMKDSLEKKDATEFDYYFALGVAGTGKTFLLIDMPEDDPQFQLNERAEITKKAYVETLEEEKDLPTILSKLRFSIDAHAKSFKAREVLVANQLGEIGEWLDGRDDLSVGVIEGGIHTSPSHLMQHAGYPISREFIKTKHLGEKGIHKRMFSWYNVAIRQRLFLPDKPLTDTFLKRVIISDILLMEGTSEDESKNMDLALEDMPDEDVEEMLFDSLYPEYIHS